MAHLSDIEIATAKKPNDILEVAEKLGIDEKYIEKYGNYKAKIKLEAKKQKKSKTNLILMTAINPTPAGEGKTTTTIGLADALSAKGEKAICVIREPSLGPVFGMKGGAAGGGYAQVIPMEDINLHFTGDLHAISAANNLLAAMIDNHIHQGNVLNIDTRKVVWRRALDMNDRQLRNIVGGLGGKSNGVPRECGFDITAASEVMAILCLAEDLSDLKTRLGKIVVAYTMSGEPVTARQIKADKAMAVLLKDAIKPNLVQTLEGTPAVVHGGPFANIAHGCNSVIATKLGMDYADYVVTEAGFGADLGAEKFLDIKCRVADIAPDAVVIVATVRALKYNGGVAKTDLSSENTRAVLDGLPNLLKHVSNIKDIFGLSTVVALNRFETDTDAEIEAIMQACGNMGVDVVTSEVWEKGSQGGLRLAEKVMALCENKSTLTHPYELNNTITEKIKKVAFKIYGAGEISFAPAAKKAISNFEKHGFSDLPVCIAKTQYSLSDNPELLGCPKGFEITIRDITLSAGAGFLVALSGSIMKMPGLPKVPSAENMDIDNEGNISGLF
ncbi:MAG: formate--tetrahydrofolate ligase [Eubacteriales bacterium]